MFKKLNTKTLLILFGGLLVLVIIMQLVKGNSGEGNFKSKIVETDTANITKITIMPTKITDKVVLAKTGNRWEVVDKKGQSFKADESMIKNIMYVFAGLKAERVAASEKSDWGRYEVTDSALHVLLEVKGKPAEDLVIGKFSAQQNPQKFTTYVRLARETEVYAVDGFLGITFNRSVNDFRDKTLVNIEPSSIADITFTYPADSSFTLTRLNKKWMINNQPADSAKVAEFASTVSHLSGYYIADEKATLGREIYSVKLGLGKNVQPVEIKAFESDTIVKYIVKSNLSDVRLDGPKSGLMQRVFQGRSHFLKMIK